MRLTTCKVAFSQAISVVIVADIDRCSTTLTMTSAPNPSLVGQTVHSGDTVYSPATCATVLFTVQTADTTLTLVSSGNPTSALTPVT